MGKFINPFMDVGFKLIFGQKVTKDLSDNEINKNEINNVM